MPGATTKLASQAGRLRAKLGAMRFAPRRPLGRTGFVATRLGAGDVADRSLPLERCVATLRRALDAGLNIVDTAPSPTRSGSPTLAA